MEKIKKGLTDGVIPPPEQKGERFQQYMANEVGKNSGIMCHIKISKFPGEEINRFVHVTNSADYPQKVIQGSFHLEDERFDFDRNRQCDSSNDEQAEGCAGMDNK